jgi:glycosyltransferase involved in cell wall biosynthesis
MRGVIAAHAVRMGGALQHLRNLLPRLAAAQPGHRWLVLTSSATADALGELPVNARVEVQETHHLDPVGRLIAERMAVARAADRVPADVILSFNGLHAPGVDRPQAMIAANALPLCAEYWRRIAAEPLAARAEARVRAMLLGWSLTHVTRVITTSNWMADSLVAQFHVALDRVRVVYHGVDDVFREVAAPDQAPARGEVGVVLAVSKHGINKDFDTVVEAAGLLHQRGRLGAAVRLTGSPQESPFSRQTARLIAARSLESVIDFTGEVSGAALAALLRTSLVCIFPSWCEAFGLPQVEAAAAGAPVIAPDLDVSRELLGDAARYYRPGDAASLARELSALLEDGELRARLGAAAAARVRDLTWQRAAQSTLQVLEEIAAPSGVAHS